MNNNQLTPRLNRIERNLLIDAGAEIWPEGISVSLPNNSDKYGAVMIKCGNSSTGVTLTATQSASVPSGSNIPFSSQLSKTASGSVAAGTYSNKTMFIEGYDISDIYSQEWSLIFWVKSSVASNRTISVRNAGQTHSYLQQYAISQADTWEMKVLKFNPVNTCPGTINRTNGVGISINFTVVAGATYQNATTNQWVTGNYVSGIGEDTTWITGTNHNFSIAGAIVIPGDWTGLDSLYYKFVRATRTFQQELACTQRYYEHTYRDGQIPRTNVGNTQGEMQARWPSAPGSSDEFYATFNFRVHKRALPTVEIWSPTGVQNVFVRDGDGVQLAAKIQAAGSNYYNAVITNNAAANTSVHRVHAIADARF